MSPGGADRHLWAHDVATTTELPLNGASRLRSM